jgi:hypothetical protein
LGISVSRFFSSFAACSPSCIWAIILPQPFRSSRLRSCSTCTAQWPPAAPWDSRAHVNLLGFTVCL